MNRLSTHHLVRVVVGVALVGSGACSQSASSESVHDGKDPVGQSYTVSVTADAPARNDLPATSEMKLLDFDVAAYIEGRCKDAWQYAQCDVFAQTDKAGSLVGYLQIEGTGDDLSFSTDTRTNPSEGRAKECRLGGTLDNIERPSANEFKAHSQFQTTDNDAVGVIYLHRVGKSLKVNDERWNYCYDDQHIDDVYTFLGSLRRNIDKSKWKSPTY